MRPTSSHRDLGGTFSSLFELTVALDEPSLRQVHQIRHEVYCRDLGWESVREDNCEVDDYDRHSIHCLLRTRDSGEPVGCTRLILTRPEAPHLPLPFEESCGDAIDRAIVDPARLPRQTIGEVSRLAVMRNYRQRKGESESPSPVSESDFAPRELGGRFPFIPVGLYLGAAAVARHVGAEHVFVLTEPRLAEHFARIGFDIRHVGRPIEHRGTRVPSLLSSSKVVSGLRPMMKSLYAVIEASVEASFAKHPCAWRSASLAHSPAPADAQEPVVSDIREADVSHV